jgi:integrase
LRGVLERIDAAPDALLFTSARGRPLRYSRLRPTVWVPTLEKLGLPKTEMHVLRHSAAARMSRAGWPAKAVQQGLGHATASFTLTVYGHLFEDDLDELAAAFEATSRGTSRVRAITR